MRRDLLTQSRYLLHRVSGNAHRYVCFAGGRIVQFETWKEALNHWLASLFGRLNSCLPMRNTEGVIASVLLAGLLSLATGLPSWALPTGETVVSGTVGFDRSVANTLNVNQTSQQAIVEYTSFNVAVGETVNFSLPSATASILNRVIGGGATNIAGTVTANGQLLLVNPSGIQFADTANITAASFVASTLGLSNSNYLSGEWTFDRGVSPSGSIVNEGSITATDYLGLLGGHVQNDGVLTATRAALAVGDQITVNMANGFAMTVTVDAALQDDVAAVAEAILNTTGGTITADTIELIANLESSLYTRVVNLEGIVQANTANIVDGIVRIQAEADTDKVAFRSAGTLTGNNLEVLANDVDITGTTTFNDTVALVATGTQPIELGDASDDGSGTTFDITKTSLESITADTIQIGSDTVTGNVTVAGDLSLSSSLDIRTQGTVDAGGQTVTLANKDLRIEATGTVDTGAIAAGMGNVVVESNDEVTVSASVTASNVEISSTDINITGTITTAADGVVTLAPSDSSAVEVAGAGSGSTFDVSSAELAAINSGGLVVGTTEQSGNLSLAGAIDISPVSAYNLTLKSGGNVDATQTILLGKNDLTVEATGTADLAVVTGDSDSIVNVTSGGETTLTGAVTTGQSTIVASDLDIQSTLDVGTGALEFRTSNSNSVILNAATDDANAATFDVDATELANVTAGSLQVGNEAMVGGITLAQSYDIGSPQMDLTLQSANNIDLGSTTISTGVETLTVAAGGTLDVGTVTGGNSTVSLTSKGNLTTVGAVTVGNAGSVVVSATETGSVALGGSVSGGSQLVLTGVSGVQQSAGTIAGQQITLGSTTGDLGASGTRIQINTASLNGDLSLSTSTAGNAFLDVTDSIAFKVGTLNGNLDVTVADTADFDAAFSAVDATIRALEFDISGSLTASNSLTLTPDGVGQAIHLGGGAVPGSTFRLTTAELGRITSPSVTIGDPVNSGAVTVGSNLSPGFDLTVQTAGSFDSSGQTITFGANDLTVNAGGLLTVGALAGSGTVTLGSGDTFMIGSDITAGTLGLVTTANNADIILAGGDVTATNNLTFTTHGTGDVVIGAGDTATSTTGNITTRSNDIILNGNMSATNGTLFFIPTQTANPIIIGLGTGDDADKNTWDLDLAALGRLSAQTIEIGDGTQTGNTDIESNLDLSNYGLTLNTVGGTDASGTTLSLGTNDFNLTGNGPVTLGTITGDANSSVNAATDGQLTANGAITAGDGVTLGGSDIDINAAIDAGSGNIVLAPGTNANVIVNAVADDANPATFDIDATELAQLSGASVTIGDTTKTGNVTLAQAFDASAAGAGSAGYDFGLKSGGTLDTSGNTITLGDQDLTLESVGTLDVDTVTGSANAVISIQSGELATIDGAIAGGDISVKAKDWDLNSTLNAGTGPVLVAPVANGNLLLGAVAADGDPNTLDVTSGDLANITAGTLKLGNSAGTGYTILQAATDVNGDYDVEFLTGGGYNGNGQTLTTGAQDATFTVGGDVDTGSIAGTTGNVSITTQDGDINLNGTVAGTAVTFAAQGTSQNIVQVSGSVTGTTLTLSSAGGDIGASGTPIQTAADTLMANAANGSIYINEADSVTVGASATSGTLEITTTGDLATSGAISAAEVTFKSNDIDLNDTVTATNDVTLVSSTDNPIIIGAAGDDANVATFDLDATELAQITATNLNVGDGTTTANATLTGTVDASNFQLQVTTTGNVDSTAATINIGDEDLVYEADGDVNTGSIISNTGNIAYKSTNGDVTVNGSLTGNDIDILLAGNDIDIQAAVNAGSNGTITLETINGNAIVLNDAADDGLTSTFDLHTAELNLLTAKTVTIGKKANAGDITLVNGFTMPGQQDYDVVLTAGGDFNAVGTTSVLGGNGLSVDVGGTVDPGTVTGGGALSFVGGGQLTTNGNLTGSSITLGGSDAAISHALTASGKVSLKPTNGNNVLVNAAADDANPATFDIDATEIALINAATLSIGDQGQSGTLTLLQDLDVSSLPSDADGADLELLAGGNIDAGSRTMTLGSHDVTIRSGATVDTGTIDGTATSSIVIEGGNNVSITNNVDGNDITVTTTANNGNIVINGGNVDAQANITLTTQGSGDVQLAAANTITTQNAQIQITANDVQLLNAVDAGALGTIILQPNSNNNILIGAAADDSNTATFDVDDAELAFLTADTVTIGNPVQNGDATLEQSQDFTGEYNLNILTGGGFDAQSNTLTMDDKNLLIDVGGVATTAAITSTSGNVTVTAGGQLHVAGAINTASAGLVTLSTDDNDSDIVLNADISGSSLTTISSDGDVTHSSGTISGDTLTISAAGGDIGSSSNRVELDVANLNVTATIDAGPPQVGGSAFFNESNTLTLGTTNVGNTLDITSSDAIITSGAINAGDTRIQTTANDANVYVTEDITANSITLGASGTGNVIQQSGTVTATSLTLSAEQGEIGTSAAPIQVDAETLTVTNTGTGDAFVREADSVTIAGVNVGDEFTLTSGGNITTSGSITADNVNLTARDGSNGAVVLGANVTGTTEVNVTADGSGTLTQAAGIILGETVRLTTETGGIGSSSNRIDTEAGQLMLVTGTGADAFVDEQDDLDLLASTVGGTLDVDAGGDVTLSGAVTAGNHVVITTTANNGAIDLNGQSLTAVNNITLTTDGTGDVDLPSGSLALSSGSGTIQIESNDVTLVGQLNAGTGQVNLFPNSDNNMVLGAASDDGNTSTFDVTAGDFANITASGTTIGRKSRNGNITVAADIDVSGAAAGAVDGNGYDLTLRAGGFFSSLARTITLGNNDLTIDVCQTGDVGRVDGGASTIQITTEDRLTIHDEIDTTQTVALTTAGNNGEIQVGANIGGGTATTLTTDGTGDITHTAGTVSGTTVSLLASGGDVGTSSNRVETATDTLTVDVAASGSAFVTEADAVTLTTVADASTFDLRAGDAITVGGTIDATDLVLQTTGNNANISVGSNVTATNSTTLTAHGSGNILQTGGTLDSASVTLTSTSGTIGTSVSAIQTDTNTLTVNTTGNVNITEVDGVSLQASTGDDFTLAAGNTVTVDGSLVADNIDLSTTGNNGNIIANAALTVNDTTLKLTANGSGTITQNAGGFTADTIELASGSGDLGSSGTRLTTTSNNLSASTTGNVFLNETSATTLQASNAGSGTGDTFNLLVAGALTTVGNTTADTLVLETTPSGADITLSAGSTLTGLSAATLTTPCDADIHVPFTAQVASNNGAIVFNTRDLDIGGTVDAGTGSVTWNNCPTGPVTLGGEAGADTADLTAVEFASIKAGSVTLSGTTDVSVIGTVNASSSIFDPDGFDLTITTTGAFDGGSQTTLIGSNDLSVTTGGTLAVGPITGLASTVSLTGGDTTTFNGTVSLGTGSTLDVEVQGTGDLVQTAGSLNAATIDLETNDGVIGTAGDAIDIDADTLTVAAGGAGNDAYLADSDGVTVNASSAADILSIEAGNTLDVAGTLTAGNSVELETTANNAAVNLGATINAPTSIDITVHGSADITQSAGTLTTATLNLASGTGNIGTSGNEISTNVDTLTANTAGTGDVFINEANEVALNNSTAGDEFVINASGNGDVTVNTGQRLVADDVTVLANDIHFGTATITATSTATFAPNNNNAVVVGNAVDDGLTTTYDLDTAEIAALTTSDLTIGNTGQTGNLTLESPLTTDFDLTLQTGGNIDTNGSAITAGNDDVTITAAGSVDVDGITGTDNNDFSVTAGDTLTVDGAITTTGTGDVSLTTTSNDNIVLNASVGGGATTTLDADGTGTITQSAGSVTGGTVNLASDSGDIGSPGNAIDLDADILGANTTGDVHVDDVDGVSLVASTGDTFVLNAGGSIEQTSGVLDATDLTLATTVGTIGTATNPFDTNVSTVTLNAPGEVAIANTGANPLTVNASSAGGDFSLTNDNSITTAGTLSGEDISLVTTANNGTITLGGNLTSTGNVTLTANGSGDIAQTGGSLSGLTVAFTSGSGDVGSSGDLFDLDVNSLSASTTGGVFVADSDELTITSLLAGNDVTVTTVGDLTASGSITGAAVDLTTTSNGDVSLQNVTATTSVDVTAGGSGDITSGTGTTLTTPTTTLASTSGVINVSTDTNTLSANTTGTVTVNEADDITLNTSTAGPLMNINTTGDITLPAGQTITLNDGTLNLTSNDIHVNDNVNVGSSGTINLLPTNNNDILIAAPTDDLNTNTYDIHAGELGNFNGGLLNIGTATGGDITLLDDWTPNLSVGLQTPGTIDTTSGTLHLGAHDLTATAGNAIDLGELTGGGNDITLTSPAITLNNDLSFNNTELTFTTDALDLGGQTLETGGGPDYEGSITIIPQTNGSTIGLGAVVDGFESGDFGLITPDPTKVPGDFVLTQDDFDLLKTANLTIGGTTNTGDINLGSVDLSTLPTNLTLSTQGDVVDITQGIDTTANIILSSTSIFTITGGTNNAGSGLIGLPSLTGDIDVIAGGILSFTDGSSIFINLQPDNLQLLLDQNQTNISTEFGNLQRTQLTNNQSVDTLVAQDVIVTFVSDESAASSTTSVTTEDGGPSLAFSAVANSTETEIAVNSRLTWLSSDDFKDEGLKVCDCIFAPSKKSDNGIDAILKSTGQLLTTVEVGNAPQRPTADGDCKRVFVPNRDDDTVSVVDAADYRVLHTIEVGDAPVAVSYAAQNNQLYVANYGEQSISVVNTDTMEVTQTISVDVKPDKVSYDATNDWLLVFGEGQILQVPLEAEVARQ